RREDEVRAGNGDNRSAELESIYTRFEEISGPPLRDGYHFGQTLYNDYGRPYGSGFNNVTGFSARATAGPLAFYFRGEYQHSASTAALPQSAREFIFEHDSFLPSVPPPSSTGELDLGRILDA